MGLLDYLNKGFDNSVGHLNELKDSLANQPKMYDPHANARALMGGQAMPYNQNVGGVPSLHPQDPLSLAADKAKAEQQNSYLPQGMLGEQVDTSIGPNMGQVNRFQGSTGMLSPQVDTGVAPNMNQVNAVDRMIPTDTTIGPNMGYGIPNKPNFPRGYNDEIIESTASMSPFDNPDMMAAIAMQESSNRHTDANGKLITSPAGAVGKYQIMPSTAAQPGFGLKPLDLATATEADHEEFSRNYLNKLNDRFGNQPDLTLAAYNYGVGNVEKLLQQYGVRWKEHLPKETSNYLKNFNML